MTAETVFPRTAKINVHCFIISDLLVERQSFTQMPTVIWVKKEVPRGSEMQSERKENQDDAKDNLQSDIQCTFC